MPDQLTINRKLKSSFDSLSNFTFEIFAHSTAVLKGGRFIGGEHITRICNYLQANNKTARVSARDHFKSLSFYDHFLWQCLRSYGEDLEAHYFSYNYNMAAYHTEKIKNAIISNPFFAELRDLKKSAESRLKFTWDGQHFITMEPHGLLEFNRGIHAPLIYVDDPFQDPANKLNINNINKINDVIKTQIMDMSQEQLHIAGTPQTKYDFFFDEDTLHDFAKLVQPAVISDKEQKVLWPEWRDYEALMAIKRNKGTRIFNQEYQCRPAYSEDSYINDAELQTIINGNLINYSIKEWTKELARRKEAGEETKNDMLAGMDIGKKRHPSNLVIFEIDGTRQIQRHIKFMDKWDYHKQLRYCEEAIKAFGIDYLWYDNTRGEFETFDEAGRLPGEMQPVNFTRKRKFAMATGFDKAVTNKTIELIDDQRQTEQIKVVDADLQALETPEGHGESFFAISLIFAEAVEDEEVPDKKEPEKPKHYSDEDILLMEDEDEEGYNI